MKRIGGIFLTPVQAGFEAYRTYLPANVRKLLGITVFLLAAYGALLYAHPSARTLYSHQLLGQRIGLYGILSLAAGMLIITGGIDLSMGSLVCLASTILAYLVTAKGKSLEVALLAILPLGVLV